MSKKKTEYERVKAVWYKKLKDSGFEDIEQEDGNMTHTAPRFLRDNDHNSLFRAQAIQDYYCLAQHFLNEYQFDSEIDKVIWEYYTHGITYREISKLLKKTGVADIHRDSIWRKIKKYEEIMKGMYLSV